MKVLDAVLCFAFLTITISSSEAVPGEYLCLKMQHRAGPSLENLPAGLRQQWNDLKCNSRIAKLNSITKTRSSPSVVVPVEARIPVLTFVNGVRETNLTVIAVTVCSTTRNTDIATLKDSPLFSELLPSFLKTAEPSFEYWFYFLFDRDDPLFDNATTVAKIKREFETKVRRFLLAKSNIHCKLAMLRFNNVEEKPGPAFNFITQAAFDDGADYILRTNDDSSFVTQNWATALTTALASLSPPNIGVVGPYCAQGNMAILTHDFTHRSHHEIFSTHYPTVLSDWWMDDWLTRVYGRKRTKLVPSATVVHHQDHGVRYLVDRSHEQHLNREIKRGRAMIENWMLHQITGPPEKNKYKIKLAHLEQYHYDDFDFMLADNKSNNNQP